MNIKKQTFVIVATRIVEKNLMRKLLFLIFLTSFCAFPAFAQGLDDYNKVEFYGGFSHASVEPNTKTFTAFGSTLEPCSSEATPALGANYQTSFCRRSGFNGFDTSITYNFSRYVGIKGNVTGHYKSDQFVDTFFGSTETLKTKKRLHNILVGVQVKDNLKTKRFKPFAHALFGAATYDFKGVNTAPDFPPNNFTLRAKVTSFAMKLGGGIDVRVHRRFDLRLIQVDYNPIFTGDYEVTGAPYSVTQKSKRMNNITVGFGIAIH